MKEEVMVVGMGVVMITGGVEGEEVTIPLDATTVMEYVVPGDKVLLNVMVVPVEEARTGEPPDVAAVAV
jgi:hypothetical protein